MKGKQILAGLLFGIFFFLVVNLIPGSGKHYYEFEEYRKTIDSSISGEVTRVISAKNFFGAQIGPDPKHYFAFTYHVERTPKEWIANYPDNFIAEGDSIKKQAGNDTFSVIRNSKVWKYVLPIDSARRNGY